MARRSPRPASDSVARRAGREPMLSRPITSTGVDARKYPTRSGSSTRVRYASYADRDTSSMTPYQRSSTSGAWRDSRWAADARTVADSASSRLRRASDGMPYLSEMTSPCSVILISPSRVRNGWARIAAPVGPPPRPTVPPRPWNRRSRTPWRAATSRSACCDRWISHSDVVMPPSLFESE